MGINIIQKTSTHNTIALSNRDIKYIVIHYTAGVTSKAGQATNVASMFSTSSTEASADFIVDDEQIVQYNPDIKNRYSWHCGGNKANSKGGSFYGIANNKNSIGIEICSTNSTGKVMNANDPTWSYTAAALSNAIELTKYLMNEYNCDIAHVIRHYDVTGKLCPGIVGWNADTGDESQWQTFLAELTLKEVDEEEMTQEQFNDMMINYRGELQDNDAADWSKEAREWAVNNGLIQGGNLLADGTPNYMWEDLLTREQMVTLLYRFAQL